MAEPETQTAGTEPFVLPQLGILAQGTHAHHFLEFDLRPGIDAREALAAFRSRPVTPGRAVAML
jgi:hypothetical protein